MACEAFGVHALLKPAIEMMDERQIVALHVVQRAAHPRVALAEPEVIGGVVLGRLAPGPVPAAAVLEVDDVEAMAADDVAAGLQPEVVDAAQGFLEDLRPHDGRADREDDAAVEVRERAAEELEVAARAARPIAAPLKTG